MFGGRERPALLELPGARLVALGGPVCDNAVEGASLKWKGRSREEVRPPHGSDYRGHNLLEEDRIVRGALAEPSLLIKALRLLVVLIHKKHYRFDAG